MPLYLIKYLEPHGEWNVWEHRIEYFELEHQMMAFLEKEYLLQIWKETEVYEIAREILVYPKVSEE